MDTCPTVRIKPSHPSQGDFVEINEEDFDPKVHELFGAKAAAASKAKEPGKPNELSALRAEFKALTGKNPSPKVKADDLRTKLEELKAAAPEAKPEDA